MAAMREQAENVGTAFISENVAEVDFSTRPFVTRTDGGQMFVGETVIIATGASAKWLGLPEEKSLYGKGVSACATCDGFFFRDKDVVVVGGGDTAIEQASFLSRMVRSITVVHRRDHLRASAIMQKRAFENPKIRFIWNSVVSAIHDPGESKVTGVTVRNVKTAHEEHVNTDGLFVAIGHEPNTKLFAGQLEMDDQGYISTRPGSPITSVAGVFAAGDVQDRVYKQAVTAAGSGCMAAVDAERFLESSGE
jgi:thioredoxin reductase (NADPH)